MLSPRGSGVRDRRGSRGVSPRDRGVRDSREDEREGQGRKENE